MTKPPLSQFWNEKDGDGRRYRHPKTEEILPSVTTILKESPKNLEQYAANLTLAWAIENWASLGGMSNEKAERSGKYRWKDHANDRAEVGDGVHSWIEAEHKGLWAFPTLDDEQEAIIEQWELLKTEHEIKPVYTELTAWYPGRFAGTMDGLWYIDGKLTLIDVKTSKSHWPEHDFQISALAHAPKALLELVPDPDPKNPDHWKEIDNPAHISKIDGAALIHLRSDLHEIIPVNHLEENYKVFAGLTQTWYARRELEEIKKQEEVNG